MNRQTRRGFLAMCLSTTAAISGCAGEDNGEEVKDSDGDGVIDSQDYAPHDPSVQSRDDIVETISTTTPTPTSTPIDLGTIDFNTPTPTSTPINLGTVVPDTPTPAGDRLHVIDGYWLRTGVSNIESYGADGLKLYIGPNQPEPSYNRAKAFVLATEYPRGQTIAEGVSDPFDRSSSWEIEFTLDMSSAPRNTRLQYLTGLIPASQTLDTVTAQDVATIMETDPFIIDRSGGISRSSHPDALPYESGRGYERNEIEGAYDLTISGSTFSKSWEVNLFAFKSAHLNALNRSRRSWAGMVGFEQTSGTAEQLAQLLDSAAEDNGFTHSRRKIELIIDYIQRMPYVPDDVSTGYDDYSKYIMETFAELGGDCEDTAILMAAVLQSDPYNIDTILIAPPGHMAVGVRNDDPQGYYYELDGYKYEYVETTGEGWSVGQIPDRYKGKQANLYQV